MQEVSRFQPTEELVSGSVHLIRPSDSNKYDNCGLTLVSLKKIVLIFIRLVSL